MENTENNSNPKLNINSEEDSIDDYEMQSNEFVFDEVKQSELYSIKHYKDAIYRGELVNTKREGKGVIVYHSGRVYEGEWLRDKRHGRGFESFVNGNVYQGDYQEGKANGKGVFTWANGEIYDGEWNNGVKEGYGIWKGLEGDSYIGQWKNSKADGYGVHQWKNGDKYEGEWRACLRHGNGSDFFHNGDQYVGQYRYGNPNGFGQYKWDNGNTYAGEFHNGMKHGRGKWKKKVDEDGSSPINNQFEGEYQNDMKNGYGEFSWKSGNKYKGNYVEDYRNGYGEMNWKDGTYYKGFWVEGIQNGLGIFIFADGFKRIGFFENNVYKSNLENIEDLQAFRKDNPHLILPENFKQEIKEYLGFYDHDSEIDENFIEKEFKKAEKEDPREETAFKTMQEIKLIQDAINNGHSKELQSQEIKLMELQVQMQQDREVERINQDKEKRFQNNYVEVRNKPMQGTIDFHTFGKTSRQSDIIHQGLNSKSKSRIDVFERDYHYSDNKNSNNTDKLVYNDFEYMRKIAQNDFGAYSYYPQPLNSQLQKQSRSTLSKNYNQTLITDTSYRSQSRNSGGHNSTSLNTSSRFNSQFQSLQPSSIASKLSTKKTKKKSYRDKTPMHLRNNLLNESILPFNKFSPYLKRLQPMRHPQQNIIAIQQQQNVDNQFNNQYIRNGKGQSEDLNQAFANKIYQTSGNSQITTYNNMKRNPNTKQLQPLQLKNNKVWLPGGIKKPIKTAGGLQSEFYNGEYENGSPSNNQNKSVLI